MTMAESEAHKAAPKTAAAKPTASKTAAAKPAVTATAASPAGTHEAQSSSRNTVPSAAAARKSAASGKLIAIVRVRSNPRMSQKEEDTLHMLHLDVPNSCVIVHEAPHTTGMIRKVHGVLSWGEVSDEVVAALRAKVKDAKAMAFRLNPPSKGYGRKGIKIAFSQGGALGNRGEKINDLIKRMLLHTT